MEVGTAVVLAAGEGQRLRPLTGNRPKPMLPAADRPILEHVLDALIDEGIFDIHIVVGYGADRVRPHFGPRYRDATLTYHRQVKQLGSGHAVMQASTALTDDFLVVNGDQVIDRSMVREVVDAHAGSDATLAVVEAEEVGHYGAVRIRGDRIVELVEHPTTGTYRLVNAGVYAFHPSVLDVIEGTPRRDGELSLTDAIVRLIEADRNVRGVVTDAFWHDATYPWDLLTVARELLERGMVATPETRREKYVHDSASVHEDATLVSPVVVGPDSTVGPGAVVGPHVVLGRNVSVDAGAVVTESVLDADTRVRPNATLVQTVAGQSVTFGPGSTVEEGPSAVRVGKTVHEDCPLGCVLADRVHLGAGALVEAGALVGTDAKIAAGSSVGGNIAAGAEVLR